MGSSSPGPAAGEGEVLLHHAGAVQDRQRGHQNGIEGVVGQADLDAEPGAQAREHGEVVLRLGRGVGGDAVQEHHLAPARDRERPLDVRERGDPDERSRGRP